jgi:hypothetical protein
MTEQQAILFRTRLESLVTERDGMIAENQQRERLDQSMAYSAEHFFELCDRINALSVEIGGAN